MGLKKLKIGFQECLVLSSVEELGFEEATDDMMSSQEGVNENQFFRKGGVVFYMTL